MTGRLVSASAALDGVLAAVDAGRGPVLWRGPDARWNPVELGPGLVAVLAGAPGAGKTALALQWTCDALLQDAGLAAFVASCEMAPPTMLRRLLARYSGVSATALRFAAIAAADTDRLKWGAATLGRFADRLFFYEGAFSLDAILAALRDGEHGPGLLVLDYLQMLRLADGEASENKRMELDSIMGQLRHIADAGAGILAVSAVARGKSSKGNSYNALNLASFKDSGGVEYGADSCWILHKGEDDGEGAGLDGLMVCECVKNRHGEPVSLPVIFDRGRMAFTVLERAP